MISKKRTLGSTWIDVNDTQSLLKYTSSFLKIYLKPPQYHYEIKFKKMETPILPHLHSSGAFASCYHSIWQTNSLLFLSPYWPSQSQDINLVETVFWHAVVKTSLLLINQKQLEWPKKICYFLQWLGRLHRARLGGIAFILLYH